MHSAVARPVLAQFEHRVNQIADLLGKDRIHIDPVIEPNETLADNSLAKELLGWIPEQKIEDWIPGYKKKLGL